MHFGPHQVALIFVSSILFFAFSQLKPKSMYKISSMQVPDQEFILPKTTMPKKTSQKKFLKDESDDSSSQQVGQNPNQTYKQNDTKQLANDSNDLQGDIKNIKGQQEKQKRRKKKKPNKNKKQMSSINKEQKKQKFNCRFYMQGSCKNGTKCKFIHPVDFPPTIPESTKPKQPKLQPFLKVKKQSSSEMKQQSQSPVKHARDVYFDRMIETMKQQCYSCRKVDILVTLSCGCQSICELCVRSRKACSKEGHVYDDKVYIK